MREYDLIVLGGGTGNIVASAAADDGFDVALVERDRLGGTCLNRGCNPSKKLIHRADAAETVRNADSLGLDASLEGVAFGDIVDEVIGEVTDAAEAKAERAREHERVDLYQVEGRFVDERTVEVDVEGENESGTTELTAERIVLAGGSRPVVPDAIDGTDEADFLTSDEALRLGAVPDRLVVAGGGYIAVEMAHLFGALGTDVAVVGRGDVLLDREDREVAERLTEAYEAKHELHLGREVTELREAGEETVVVAESTDESGENGDGGGGGEDGDGRVELAGDEVLLATGRRPNTDRWNVSAAGLDTDDDGFVETDEFLETSVDGVYAIGDIAGNYMFKHSGDKEAEHVVESLVDGSRSAVSYPGMAHAVFGSPQVGSLGKTEGELDGGYEVGTYAYDDTALGSVLADDEGFAKALVAADGEVLGFHVVGPHASMLVHEVSTAVAAGADAETIAETIHVHPALSEVVQGAFRDVRDVAPSGI